MQLSVHQFYLSTTCFGHIGPSSATITIVAHIKKQEYNETALATIVIVPDDGPMWPKHVVLR
jgi:hypothetical protein